MINIIVKKEHKSIPVGVDVQLPNFCILTGKNGAGKSHLLESLVQESKTTVIVDGKKASKIKYIPFNGLNPNVDSKCEYNTIINHVKNIWNQFSPVRDSYLLKKKQGQLPQGQNEIEWLMNHIGDANHKRAIKAVLEKSHLSVEEQTEDLFRKYFDFNTLVPEEMFASQFATVFKAYHTRLEDNRYQLFKNKEYGETNNVLSDEEFIVIYGPKPWDLINEILRNAKLPYIVNDPLSQNKESEFTLKLNNPESGLSIQVNDLSTGEKVLMSLALAIYNATETGAKLDLLLLDEPDAGLHPEFSRLLIESLNEYIYKRAGVSVIITTHSPTTVAVADGIYIYEMDKSLKKPIKSNHENAIRILTSEIRNLRINIERRRQIFVENNYDVEYYEKIYRIVKSDTSVHLQFIPPHSRLGTNCTDVIDIVTKLRELGNDLIYGIIDWDLKNTESVYIKVLGENNRYSIENYIFDPIYLFLLLLRENIKKPSDFGLSNINNYVDCKRIAVEDMQNAINYLMTTINIDIKDMTRYETINHSSYSVPSQWFSMKGHDLEEYIVTKIPELNRIKKGKTEDNILKNYIIDTVINDFPEHLSLDILQLFMKIV